MRLRKVPHVFAVLTVASLGGFEPAAAQDCGEECVICGVNKKEGKTYGTGTGPYHMDCEYVGASGPCYTEGCDASSNDELIPSDMIAELVASVPVEAFELIVEAYGDRIFFARERRAVAVTGVGCEGNSVARMVFLLPDESEAMAQLDVRSLRSLLASRANDPQAPAGAVLH